MLSATGRAYLAALHDVEREQILANIIEAREPGFEIARDRSRLDKLLAQTRPRGFGLRYGEEPIDTGAIAVPITCEQRVLGCVNLTFIKPGISPADAAERCLAPMLAAANAIAEGASCTNSAGFSTNMTGSDGC